MKKDRCFDSCARLPSEAARDEPLTPLEDSLRARLSKERSEPRTQRSKRLRETNLSKERSEPRTQRSEVSGLVGEPRTQRSGVSGRMGRAAYSARRLAACAARTPSLAGNDYTPDGWSSPEARGRLTPAPRIQGNRA
jgi:hypothetical protein